MRYSTHLNKNKKGASPEHPSALGRK
jgi:uncharacterized protein YjbI with pentapeptide repeats